MLVQLRVIGIIRFPVRSTYIELNEPSSNIGVIFQATKIVTEIYISFRDTGDFPPGVTVAMEGSSDFQVRT